WEGRDEDPITRRPTLRVFLGPRPPHGGGEVGAAGPLLGRSGSPSGRGTSSRLVPTECYSATPSPAPRPPGGGRRRWARPCSPSSPPRRSTSSPHPCPS